MLACNFTTNYKEFIDLIYTSCKTRRGGRKAVDNNTGQLHFVLWNSFLFSNDYLHEKAMFSKRLKHLIEDCKIMVKAMGDVFALRIKWANSFVAFGTSYKFNEQVLIALVNTKDLTFLFSSEYFENWVWKKRHFRLLKGNSKKQTTIS